MMEPAWGFHGSAHMTFGARTIVRVFLLAGAFLWSCSSPVEIEGSTLPGKCEASQPLVAPQKLDILFVIDNSGSMKEEQASVARELLAFIDELKRGGGVSGDFHVGVITTSIYQQASIDGVLYKKDYPEQSGRLQPVPELKPDGTFVPGTGTERLLLGTDPNLIEKFGRLVQVGISGSGQETPFEAARLALSPPLMEKPLSEGGNLGFLRDRARLLVVVVTDEEDCSEERRPPEVTVGDVKYLYDCAVQGSKLTSVAEYHQFFSNLVDGTGAKRDVVWATIGPVGVSNKEAQLVVLGNQTQNIDCPTSFGPGNRHRLMAELFDSSLENLDSICKPSYKDMLVKIAGLANVSQTLAVRNVIDPKMLVIDVVRLDGSKSRCSLLNGGLTDFDPPVGDEPARVTFGGACRRRIDDQAVEIRLICAF